MSILELGRLVAQPRRVLGGLSHRTWHIVTTTGEYAIKQLNPKLMVYQASYELLRLTEIIAAEYAKRGVSTISAIMHHADPLIIIDKNVYMVFPWIKADLLKPEQVTITHANKIAGLLSKLHNINLQVNGLSDPTEWDAQEDDDWHALLNKASAAKLDFANELPPILSNINKWNDNYLLAAPLIKQVQVISHGDLDYTNVLWQHDEPIIIDWEGANLINPTQELISTALIWSGLLETKVNEAVFMAMIKQYQAAGGKLTSDPKHSLYFILGNYVGLLGFYVRLAIGETALDAEDQAMGLEQAAKTIKTINYMAVNIGSWYKCIMSAANL